MRIQYEGVALSGEGAEGPDGLLFNGSPVVQVEELVRAKDIVIFDRKRKRNEVSWRVSRQHANEAAAEAFTITHSDSLPNKGKLTLRTQGANGSVSGSVQFEQASVSASTEMVGVTTITQYAAICGKGKRA